MVGDTHPCRFWLFRKHAWESKPNAEGWIIPMQQFRRCRSCGEWQAKGGPPGWAISGLPWHKIEVPFK